MGRRAVTSVAAEAFEFVGPSDRKADGGAGFAVGGAIYFSWARIAGRRSTGTRGAAHEVRTAKYADVPDVHAVLGAFHAETIAIYAFAAVNHASDGVRCAARGLTRVDGRVNQAVVAVTCARARVTYAEVDVGHDDGGVSHTDGGVISFVRCGERSFVRQHDGEV